MDAFDLDKTTHDITLEETNILIIDNSRMALTFK